MPEEGFRAPGTEATGNDELIDVYAGRWAWVLGNETGLILWNNNKLSSPKYFSGPWNMNCKEIWLLINIMGDFYK